MPVTTLRLESLNDFDEWRNLARALLRAGVRPEETAWAGPDAAPDLFAPPPAPLPPARRPVGRVPPKFIAMAQSAICHADPERFALLYRLLWRLQKDHGILALLSDPDVGKLLRRVSAVHRDSHKMTAFVRFRSFAGPEGEARYAAWFEPDHYILERTAPFFVRRFSAMRWSILTPYRAAHWDGSALAFGPGASRADVPADDALEETWRTYFAAIFNPARLNVAAMKSEMPVKYWRNLPEASIIPSLVRGAKAAEEAMVARIASQPSSRHLKQIERREAERDEAAQILSLADARAAVQGCERCPLYQFATQAVFGAGPEHASIMFVGEQPGDQEDLAGAPFVGPAGKLFDATLEEVGIDRQAVYVTNAVKHFKYEPRGKKRIHKKPNAGEVQACKFWLNLERAFVKPRLIVALGATAAQSLLGRAASVSSLRGEPVPLPDGGHLLVTIHPSYLLRMPDRTEAQRERARFADDLRLARDFVAARH